MSENPEVGGQCSQATPEELKRRRIKCWWMTCNRRAWLEDWTGARYCFYHTYYTIRWSGGKAWPQISQLRFYYGGW